ncbi:MAG: class I SAM-dependent methyltransferase [Cyanobacteria bacterium P01_A01_bin.135]
MAKRTASNSDWAAGVGQLGQTSQGIADAIAAVARRYDQAYRGDAFELPEEVEAMPIFHDWSSGRLAARTTSPFWDIAQPRKNDRCLDIGCGVSFLIYPWCEWNAYFYGQEVSSVAQQVLNTRSPQLNSKLFKGVVQAPAHRLDYDPDQFDLAIATGVSCYYPIDYWETVLAAVRRVVKPGGIFVFDVVNTDQELAENWAILETYLGAEVLLEPPDAWQQLIKKSGATLVSQRPGDIFTLYKVRVP